MFGLRLKSWMETHLGRPRQKSGHQSQKNARGGKDGPDPMSCPSSSSDTFPSTDPSNCTAESLSPQEHGESSSRQRQSVISNLDPTLSSDLPIVFKAPSNSSVPAQSIGLGESARLLENQGKDHPTKDYEEKVEEQHHQQRTTCPRSSTTGSVSNCTGHNILLGAFCNNLSSPDTGYSTDGYSPKSGYPVLSFESSGKSTPKSSYTISSLVSSELQLSKGTTATASLSSASCSVNIGLESDQDNECTSPSGGRILLKTSASVSDTDRSNNLGLGDGIGRNSLDGSSHQNPSLSHSHSIKHEFNNESSPVPNAWDSCRGNDAVRSTQCNSAELSLAPKTTFAQHQQPLEDNLGSMVAAKAPLSNFTSQCHQDKNENSSSISDYSRASTNPFLTDNQIPVVSDSFPYDNNLRNHKRTGGESQDELKSSKSGSEGNSSSQLTTLANRNIRTSFVLVTSQIPECNSLKNPFSIGSPRKERTRIKTNPWIITYAKGSEENSNANSGESGSSTHAVMNNSSEVYRQRSVGLGEGMEKVDMVSNSRPLFNNRIDTAVGEINNTGEEEEERNHIHANTTESSSLVYRISASTSASDSGKGSLDLETNRNSTESSCFLSDSAPATARNSIISQEAEFELSQSSTSSDSLQTQNEHKTVEAPHQRAPSASVKVSKPNSLTVSGDNSRKSSPQQSKKCSNPGSKTHNNSSSNNHNPTNETSHLEELDLTSTSITLPSEIVATASVSAQTNVVMVDKETDILSDWANTDEDGEDEIETDKNEDDDERVTPTPSTPDSHLRDRGIFQNSRSTSSVTDIDFGDSSAATAASSVGQPQSSIFRRQFSPHRSQDKRSGKNGNGQFVSSNIVNLDTTMYRGESPVNVFRKELSWNQSELLHDQEEASSFPQRDILSLTKSGIIRPTSHALGIPNANISLSSLYSNASEPFDYNANNKPQSSSSNPLTRGALGFLRKIFKKGSCSSSRSSPGKDKGSRVSKVNGCRADSIGSISGVRSGLVTADALVSPHPLAARKQAINGYFLTPTPNAFRRRSTTGTDSSDSKSSKHHKPVKTDIIRLPSGPLSPAQVGHTVSFNSNSSTSSSNHTSIGAYCMSTFQGGAESITGNENHKITTTNSTASSIQSMSTSTSISTGVGESHANGHRGSPTRKQNQSRLNDNFYSNSDTCRQYSFAENARQYPPPQPKPATQSRSSSHSQNASRDVIRSESQRKERETSQTAQRPPSRSGNPGCPLESPRPPNPQHRINSPSFNNYSPIHRLVVTGGNHLLSRAPSSSASPAPHFYHPSESPQHPSVRHDGVGGVGGLNHGHNNNTSSNYPSNINRPTSAHPPTSSPSPLINHHHQSSASSPRPQLQQSSSSFASPSPILRNPRYQYITSSNQNSPVLNVPRRINGTAPTQLPNNQRYYYNNHNQGQFPSGHPQPTFSTFSPQPPPRNFQAPSNSQFPVPSPNLNRHHEQISRQSRSGSVECEFEVLNPTNPQQTFSLSSDSPSHNRNPISRSQSYQTQPPQVHYYASQVVTQSTPQSQMQQQRAHPPMHPTSLSFNEPPLLMRAHLHNQNVRLNNFLLNKQRHQQNRHAGAPAGRLPNSDSIQERIYETVDSEDEDEENSNAEEEDFNYMDNRHPYPNSHGQRASHRARLPTTISDPESGFQFPNKCHASKTRTQQSSKSTNRRSKAKPPQYDSQAYAEKYDPAALYNQAPRPRVPMALFGPNTFLSETETRLLDTDREADRKYKRLINEAEALLREISAIKSQQPLVHRNLNPAEDCPQSDPLRRKAYDCWALRRLQQELAGCCASPPVLHRSRMNLQSPSTPTAGSHPYFSLAPNQPLTNPPFTVIHSQNNANF